MPRLSEAPVGRAIHRSVTHVAAGARELHGVGQFHSVRAEQLRLGEVVQGKAVEVVADGGDELVRREPYQMGAALNRGRGRLEAQGRNPVDLLQGTGVVKQKMLAGVAEETHTSVGAHGDRVTGSDAVVIDDLVRVRGVVRVVEEKAYSGQALKAVDAVAVEGDVKRVWIAFEIEGHLPLPVAGGDVPTAAGIAQQSGARTSRRNWRPYTRPRLQRGQERRHCMVDPVSFITGGAASLSGSGGSSEDTTTYKVVSTVQGGAKPVQLDSTVGGGERAVEIDLGLDDVNVEVGGTGTPVHTHHRAQGARPHQDRLRGRLGFRRDPSDRFRYLVKVGRRTPYGRRLPQRRANQIAQGMHPPAIPEPLRHEDPRCRTGRFRLDGPIRDGDI